VRRARRLAARVGNGSRARKWESPQQWLAQWKERLALQQQTEKAIYYLGLMDRGLNDQGMVLIGPTRVEYQKTLTLVESQASVERLAQWRAS
jgi:hypothetical protein